MPALMRRRRSRTRGIALVVLALALLGGCVSDEEASSESSTAPEVSVAISAPSPSSTLVQPTKWVRYEPLVLLHADDATTPGGLLAFDDGFLLSMSLGIDGPLYKVAQLETSAAQVRLNEDEPKFAGTYAGVRRGMDAGRLVWPMTEDRSMPDAPDSALDLYLYDWERAETRRLTENAEADTDPAIAGDWVAWTEGSGSADSSRVLFQNLSTGETHLMSSPDLDAFGVSLYEDQAAWVQQADDGSWEIWYRELPEGEPRRVEGDYPGTPPVQPPLLGPAGVMWVDSEEERDRAGRIWLAARSPEGLQPGEPLGLSAPAEWASLHGELILWQGPAPEDPSEYPSLMLYDLAREQELELGPGTLVGSNSDLGSEEGLVAWAKRTDAAWLVQAYNGESGTVETLQEVPLSQAGPGFVPEPMVDGDRIAWRAPLPAEDGGDLALWVVERRK